MNEPQIRFEDGAAYDDYMGQWSLRVGEAFLRWLAPQPGGRWADVGCGTGAFSRMLLDQAGAAQVEGIDPAPAQLEFARHQMAGRPADFQVGEATALPYASASLDAAVMALVIFFVPEPQRGVAEMVRVVKPGGSVSAYAWDFFGGGFPYAAMKEEMAALGTPAILPPSVEVSRMAALQALWQAAGLVEIETTVIDVRRSFADFETYWRIAMTGPPVVARIAGMSTADVQTLKARLRARLPADAQGRVTPGARANAIKARVPLAAQ